MNDTVKQKEIRSTQLTPSRSIIIYLVTLFILVLLNTERVIPILNRLSNDFPLVSIAAQFIQKTAEISKLTELSTFESTIIKQVSLNTVIGEIPVHKSYPQQEKEKDTSPLYPEKLEETNKIQKDTVMDHTELHLTNELSPLLSSTPNLESNQSETLSTSHINIIDQFTPSNNKDTILIIGDSMINEGLGPVLQKTLHNQYPFKVIREGKYSTGLSRPDYFNWPERLSFLVNKHYPKLIILCLGANDAQDIFDDNHHRYHPGSQEWKKIYTNRAKHLLNIATSKGAYVIWAGLPIMGKVPYATRIQYVTECQKKACDETLNTRFIDTQSVLATPQGKYTTYNQESNKHIRLRAKDKIHVTEAGGKLLTNHLMPYIKHSLEAITINAENE